MTSDDLHQQVEDFAATLTATLRGVLGHRAHELQATQLNDDRFFVRPADVAGFALTRDGEPFLRLRVMFRCGWDSHRAFPRVDRSEIHLLADNGDTEPLLRYEFEASTHKLIPSAHLQIHTNDPRIAKALGLAGKRTSRSRRRAKGHGDCSVSSIHLPLGGTRFRPALEDVLQMVVEEFGVDAEDGWRQHLEDGREGWRRTQTRAVVRDAPEEAVVVLRRLGYEVGPPPAGLPEDRLDRLREP